MRKLIHSKFELDLSLYKISDTEENNWFSDSFFTKYTFPFNIDLTDHLDAAFGFISMYNTNPQTFYEVKYVHNNVIEDAIFEIEGLDNYLRCTVRFGFEQLPSFDKKLSELSLDKFNFPNGISIYQHAETVINKKWPEVNYNFKQVHVDKYDPETELWNGFEKIINNKKNGIWLTNTVDTVEDITYNRNVMQPMPYWLHILQRGMADAGYVLAGDILEDYLLKKALLYADVDYFSKPSVMEDINIFQSSADAIPFNSHVKYNFYSIIPVQGKYALYGTITTNSVSNIGSFFRIKHKNKIIFEINAEKISNWNYFKTYDVDLEFETEIGFNDLSIETYQQSSNDKSIMSLTLACLRINDETGTPIPTITNENKIDLKKSVPNITFGDFVKVVKNWFNYDLTIVGNQALMNRIEKEISYDNAIDLQFSEIKKVPRKFNSGLSFLLKFQEIENAEYKYLPVFVNNEGIYNSNYTETDKTTPIEIPALPLPLLYRNGVTTAYAIENNDSKAFLIVDDNISDGSNLTGTNTDFLIPAVHERYWKKWFNFRINGHPFDWAFKAFNHQIVNLKAKRKIFAYNRYHIIKTINKTESKPDEYDIDIETEALP